jgi:hypothetical protein
MKLNYIIIKILLLLVCFTGSLSYATEVLLNASVTPEKGTVGVPLTYALTISGFDPASLKIALPEKKIVYPEKKIEKAADKKNTEDKSPDEFVPLYIINSASRDESEVNGIRQINIKMILSYYRPGTYTLPEIKISGSDGTAIGYKIPSVIIEEFNKDGNLEEIEPPVSLSGNYTRIIWIIAAILVLSAALFFLYRYLKKRKAPALVETPQIPPIEIFLREVDSLKLKELIESGEINQYVFAISIIFRRYLSSMLVFDAAEMTTDEIASKIKKYMPNELYSVFGEEIISNMRLWDFSKFAEFAPSRELLLENLEATISSAKRISGMKGSENGTSGI